MANTILDLHIYNKDILEMIKQMWFEGCYFVSEYNEKTLGKIERKLVASIFSFSNNNSEAMSLGKIELLVSITF